MHGDDDDGSYVAARFSLKFHSSFSLSLSLSFVIVCCFFCFFVIITYLHGANVCARMRTHHAATIRRHFKLFSLLVFFSFFVSHKLLLFWGYSLSSNNIYLASSICSLAAQRCRHWNAQRPMVIAASINMCRTCFGS